MRTGRLLIMGWIWILAAFVASLAILAVYFCGSAVQTIRMELQVVDRSNGSPLANAAVSAETFKQQFEYTTDRDGHCTIVAPWKETTPLEILVAANGYASARAYWQGLANEDPIPGRFIIELAPTAPIGGQVIDEEGHPIGGVEVDVVFAGKPYPLRTHYHVADRIAITDTDGFWQYNDVPEDANKIATRFNHPDFLGDIDYEPQDVESLKKLTAIHTMRKGAFIEGIIRDTSGKPIAGASVFMGRYRRQNQEEDLIASDSNGHYIFDNLRTGWYTLTVEAPGHSPRCERLLIGDSGLKVDFELGEPHLLCGLIVDSDDNPVLGARVRVDEWQDERTLAWEMETGEDGRFRWENAPADAVQLRISTRDFRDVYGYEAIPGKEEHVITLKRPSVITGTVLDAETGEPIRDFQTIQGIKLPSGTYWMNRFRNRPPNGRNRSPNDRSGPPNGRYGSQNNTYGFFEIIDRSTVMYGQQAESRVLRIDARGYQSEISPVFCLSEEPQKFDFQLKKMEWPEGIVRMSDGLPANEARIVIYNSNESNQISDRFHSGEERMTRTDEEGHFSFAPPADPYAIFVDHDDGCAWVESPFSDYPIEIQLTPWACVEGRLDINGLSHINQTIAIRSLKPFVPGNPYAGIHYTTETEQHGKFRFPHVVPGEYYIGLLPSGAMQPFGGMRPFGRMRFFGRFFPVEDSDTSNRYSHTQLLTLQSGETANIAIGEPGRPIVGQLLAANGDEIQWKYANATIARNQSSSQPSNTPQTTRGIDTDHPMYLCNVYPDGTFRSLEIPAGSYRLTIELGDPQMSGEHSCTEMESFVVAEHEFTVPELADEIDRPPLDIGTVNCTITQALGIGEPIPDIEFQTLDGETIHMQELRGKVVLLEFWASLCERCKSRIPRLQEIFEKYKQQDDLVILGMARDDQKHLLEEFIKENNIPWKQCFLRALANGNVLERLAIQGKPAALLIGKDGRLLSTLADDTQILAEVEKALQL